MCLYLVITLVVSFQSLVLIDMASYEHNMDKDNMSWDEMDKRMSHMRGFLRSLSESAPPQPGGARPKQYFKPFVPELKPISQSTPIKLEGARQKVKPPATDACSKVQPAPDHANKTNIICDPRVLRPRFPIFSGEDKCETSFEVWKSDVKCAISEGTCSDALILQAIRTSLKGKALSLLLTLPNANPTEIIAKLEGVYGNIYPTEQLIQQFYGAKQNEGESVADYGMRLERLLQTCIDRGDISAVVRNEMLRSKLWSGLTDQSLRNASRYKYDSIEDFDLLRMELRTIELDMKSAPPSSHPPKATESATNSTKKGTVSQVSDRNDTAMRDIMSKLDSISKRMDSMEKKFEGSKVKPASTDTHSDSHYQTRSYGRSGYRGSNRGGFRGGYRGRGGFDDGFRGNARGEFRGRNQRGRGNSRGYGSGYQGYSNHLNW